MPGYGSQTSPLDRWAIVAYVRALQRSRSPKPGDVPGGPLPGAPAPPAVTFARTPCCNQITPRPPKTRAPGSRGFLDGLGLGQRRAGRAGRRGGAGLAVTHDHFGYFLHTYLVSYCYVLSIALGALFFVEVQHAARAGWSVTVRRLAEILAGILPWLTILFLPILLPMLWGIASLYPWVDAAAIGRDPALQHKAAVFESALFRHPGGVLFCRMGAVCPLFPPPLAAARQIGRFSVTLRMERASPVALILFALTITFAAFDWLMSLEPHWFSTIYGVLYFSGAAVGGLVGVDFGGPRFARHRPAYPLHYRRALSRFRQAAFVVRDLLGLHRLFPILIDLVRQPAGRNRLVSIPPSGAWAKVAAILLFGHLLIPFLGLLSRHAKRRNSCWDFGPYGCWWSTGSIYIGW